jgi:riboflavin synthase
VVDVNNGIHTIEVVQETLSKTTIGTWMAGRKVNLEKALSPMSLLDGHMVQGHVDTTVVCQEINDLDGSWLMSFNLPRQFAALIIAQGSVCLNGVSLTVAELGKDSFSVAIIPYTFNNTNFRYLKKGDEVNVEFDLIGKYIVRQIELRSLTE